MQKAFDFALDRTEHCFKHITIKGYRIKNSATFNHLHSDQYSQFLYYLANSNWRLDGDVKISDKLILLNKALHGCWFSYKGNLPDIFVLIHPVGTVLGNAKYSDYLVVMQNVTVNTGEILDGHNTPIIGKGVSLCAGSSIIGNDTIGDWVTIGVGACVYKQKTPSNSIVYVDYEGRQRIRKNHTCMAYEYFDGIK